MDKQLKEKAIKIKGKDYVLVADRVKYFNDTYKNGSITTKLIPDSDRIVIKAIVTPDVTTPTRIFTGYSQASFGDNNMVNKTSALENAETSAVGRALAFMGIGVIESVSSVDEIRKAQSCQNDETFNHKPTTAPQNDQPNICSQCGVGVDDDVKGYSLKKYGKVLCRDCQKLN